MKKFFIIAIIAATLAACGDDKDKAAETPAGEAAKPEASAPESNPDYDAGLELVSKSDCFTCHKVDELLTGPSYKDVANKYAGASASQITELAQKIIKGSSGVWGSSVAMSAHPSVTQEDAEKMIKYILLLKN